ncbi:hypothetical protein NC651_040614 [Populus alba x Populus x berolinensis]|nr:hypothetical protein NC651_040614 [Populus alba x Populus x berolinensis]
MAVALSFPLCTLTLQPNNFICCHPSCLASLPAEFRLYFKGYGKRTDAQKRYLDIFMLSLLPSSFSITSCCYRNLYFIISTLGISIGYFLSDPAMILFQFPSIRWYGVCKYKESMVDEHFNHFFSKPRACLFRFPTNKEKIRKKKSPLETLLHHGLSMSLHNPRPPKMVKHRFTY